MNQREGNQKHAPGSDGRGCSLRWNRFRAAVADRPKVLATCSGSCGINKPCATGCLCIFPMETGSPFCSAHAIPGATVLK